MYCAEEKTNKLQVHLVAHSSGDLMRISFTIAYMPYDLLRNLS